MFAPLRLLIVVNPSVVVGHGYHLGLMRGREGNHQGSYGLTGCVPPWLLGKASSPHEAPTRLPRTKYLGT